MNIEDVILGLLDGASTFNYNALLKAIGIGLLIIWFFVVVWVWLDSGDRSKSVFFRVISVIGVAIFNVLGLIIYLLIRPKTFVDDEYWSELERRYLLYETAELKDCETCGYQLSPGFNVCPNCSNPIKLECENCEMMINKEWAFCPYCSFEQKPVTQDQLEMKTASLVTGMAVNEENKKKSSSQKSAQKEVSEIEQETKSVETAAEHQDLDENDRSNVEQMEQVVQEEEIETDNVEQSLDQQANNETRPTSTVKPDPASRLGGAVLSGLYGIGEKIHMTALKISGPLNSQDQQGEQEKEDAKGEKAVEDDKTVEKDSAADEANSTEEEVKDKPTKKNKKSKNKSKNKQSSNNKKK